MTDQTAPVTDAIDAKHGDKDYGEMYQHASALERQRDAARAIIASCHAAIGEDTGSDDASLPDVIAQIIREHKAEIYELRNDAEQCREISTLLRNAVLGNWS